MDVIEAIESRKSVRAFKPDPVPKKVLTRILEVALRAPSTDNTQPWEFAIVTGPILADLKKALSDKMGASSRIILISFSLCQSFLPLPPSAVSE